MGLTLTSEPIRTIDGLTSAANAARSQIPFILTTTEQGNTNFKIQIKIVDTSGSDLIPTTFKYSPKSDGVLFLDVGQIMTEYLEKNGLVSVEFKIKYAQSFGTTSPEFQTSTESYLAVYAQKQIYSDGGANLYNHLFKTGGSGTALTKWTVPRIYSQWKRTIGILYDGQFTSTIQIQYLYRDKTVISSNAATTVPATNGVQNLDLQNYSVAIPSNAYWVRANFGTKLASLDYKVTRDCKNPIFIEYLNSLGAYEQYLFDIKQEVKVSTSTGISSSRAINEDYSSVRVTNIRVANDWIQEIICETDQLSNDDLQAIAEIKRSTSVRVLLTRDGSKFVQVVVSNNFSDTFSTDNANNNFQLQLQMPNNFNVFDAINYELTPSQMHLNVAFTAAYN